MINFKDKIINLLDKFKKLELDKKKVFLIIAVSLVIIYIDFALIIKLQLKSIAAIGPKIIKLKNDIATLTQDLSKMKNLEGKQTQTKEGAGQVKKIISENEIPLLLQVISSIANKNNIRIMQMQPSKESKARQDKASKDTLKCVPILITLDLTCSYHNFGKFINDLENAEEFIVVQDMKIARDANDYLRQSVNLILRTYVRK